jgi:hypothetical protein
MVGNGAPTVRSLDRSGDAPLPTLRLVLATLL